MNKRHERTGDRPCPCRQALDTDPQFLIEERRRFPERQRRPQRADPRRRAGLQGDRPVVAFGELGDRSATGSATPATVNVQGEVQKPLDVLSNEIFLDPHTSGAAIWPAWRRRKWTEPYQIPPPAPRAASTCWCSTRSTARRNIDVNVSVGSIFSILRAPPDASTAAATCEADFLQPGTQQVAAGYALYGPTTMLVLTVGNGVARLHADPESANSC